MVSVMPVIYLTYMFISLYMLTLFIMIYLQNKNRFFYYPKARKKYSVSFIVPAYNEEDSIKGTIEQIFDIDYKNIKEVIVVNDCSTDNTLKIVKEIAKKHSKIKVLDNKKNLGKADSLNRAWKIARGELIAVVDADSFPAKDSIGKMVGFFDDKEVGAVTCPVLARNRGKFFENLQGIEYRAISFGRKLLEFVQAIYVTPGPLALYRKTALVDIGGFDKKNMTEDIEVTWHLAAKGWDRKMCLNTSVTSIVPSKIRQWWVQRRRWNIGGLQCISKYRKDIGKKGMLGWFIIPFFMVNLFLGMLGLIIFSYLFLSRIITNFLRTRYSIEAGTPIITMQDFHITPSVLNYFGVILFILGFVFVIFSLAVLKEKIMKKQNILNIPFYLTIYLILYPFIMVDAIWHTARKKHVWR